MAAETAPCPTALEQSDCPAILLSSAATCPLRLQGAHSAATALHAAARAHCSLQRRLPSSSSPRRHKALHEAMVPMAIRHHQSMVQRRMVTAPLEPRALTSASRPPFDMLRAPAQLVLPTVTPAQTIHGAAAVLSSCDQPSTMALDRAQHLAVISTRTSGAPVARVEGNSSLTRMACRSMSQRQRPSPTSTRTHQTQTPLAAWITWSSGALTSLLLIRNTHSTISSETTGRSTE